MNGAYIAFQNLLQLRSIVHSWQIVLKRSPAVIVDEIKSIILFNPFESIVHIAIHHILNE